MKPKMIFWKDDKIDEFLSRPMKETERERGRRKERD